MATEAHIELVSATYQDGSAEPTVFSQPVGSQPQTEDVQGKTAYLSALRAQLGEVQSQVNAFLTRKMEEEKQRTGESTAASKKSRQQEEREEEMYGEENAEEED